MKTLGFWTIPLIAPDIISHLTSQPHLTRAGAIGAEIILATVCIAVWVWCGKGILRTYRKAIVKAAVDDMYASSWAAKLEGETYLMVPANEPMREKIRETNRLVMDIGKSKEPA